MAVKATNCCFKVWKHHQTPESWASFVQAHNLCSKTINNAKTYFVNHISKKIAPCQSGSHSFWPLTKVVSHNFCHTSFPPRNTTLAHLCALLLPKPTSLHQPLLPILLLMTKGSYLLSTLHQTLQCPQLDSLHAKLRRSFFNLIPLNPKDQMVWLL